MSEYFIEFLTRSGCHLCEDAEPTIRRVAKMAAAGLQVIDIDEDPEMAVDWDLRIPVVLDPDGKVLAEGRIAALSLLGGVLRSRLRRLLVALG